VALIRTDVSEDRIASIFRVTEYEQVQSETVSSCIVAVYTVLLITRKMFYIVTAALNG
jgi:hypothetical protein